VDKYRSKTGEYVWTEREPVNADENEVVDTRNLNEPQGFINSISPDRKRAADRYAMCLGCDRFRRATRQCRECGCFMPVKVRVPNVNCPLGKW